MSSVLSILPLTSLKKFKDAVSVAGGGGTTTLTISSPLTKRVAIFATTPSGAADIAVNCLITLPDGTTVTGSSFPAWTNNGGSTMAATGTAGGLGFAVNIYEVNGLPFTLRVTNNNVGAQNITAYYAEYTQ